MNARPFFDTNILIYLLGSDPGKAAIAESLLARGGVCSVQVLNEIASVMRRKIEAPWPDIVDFTGGVRRFLVVAPLTLETHERALHLAPRYSLSFYDALIVAAAAEAGSPVLYSEDMHHGLIVDGQVRIVNPFA